MKQYLPRRRFASKHLVKIAIIVLMSLGSVGIIGVGLVLREVFSGAKEAKTVNNTSRYREIRHKFWSNQHLVKHFPDDIPTNASDVHLAYSPGALQGGSFFQLRLKLPAEEIKKSLNKYRTITKYKYRGGNTNDHANLPNGVPTTFFYTSGSKEDSFPDSYEILVLGANDRGSRDFKWNHGNSFGVAINSSISEIIYWVEEW